MANTGMLVVFCTYITFSELGKLTMHSLFVYVSLIQTDIKKNE